MSAGRFDTVLAKAEELVADTDAILGDVLEEALRIALHDAFVIEGAHRADATVEASTYASD